MSPQENAKFEYVAGYVIEFTDGGEPEGRVLHRGTKEECHKIKDETNGVTYSGDRSVKDGHFFVVPAAAYDVFKEGGGSA